MNNLIIDLIIRIKNGYMARLPQVSVPFSRQSEEVVKKLKQLGYAKNYKVKERTITVELLYNGNEPSLTDVKIFSKPGGRYYVSYRELKPVVGGFGSSILSTSKGILTNREARKLKSGGELLFNIW